MHKKKRDTTEHISIIIKICRITPSDNVKYILFVSTHGKFMKIDHILGHITNCTNNNKKKTEI